MFSLVKITVLLLALNAALVSANYNYQAVVETGYYFNPVVGSIKLSVSSFNNVVSNEFRIVE